jgi:hypothetical protein
MASATMGTNVISATVFAFPILLMLLLFFMLPVQALY